MKKNLYRVFAFMSIFLLSLSFVPLSAYASDDLTEILIPESLLSNFEEKEEIEALAAEVADMANCFEEDGFHAEVSDVDFSKAYCIFVEADILKEMPETSEELYKLLDLARRVWNIPVYANGKIVEVQVSRAWELSEIDLENCTEEEIERLKEKAGKWHTVSCSMDENGEMTGQGIKEILSANHKNMEQCKSVIIGGESGIRTLLAIVIENDAVSGAISLERPVSYTSDESAQKKKALNATALKSNTGEDENEVILQENQMYPLDEFAKVVSQNPEGSHLYMGLDGALSGNEAKGSAVGYYIAGGAAVLGIIIVAGIFIYGRLVKKH